MRGGCSAPGRGPASPTSTSRSHAGSRATSPRRRASARRASRSSTTGSRRTGEPKPYGDEAPRLLCVGRLIPIKGHIVLLRAFAAAKKEVPGLELDIAGRGPLEPALRALARELGIADSVRFLGYVAPIQSAIERSAIVVVPSMGEGFGMVALEAMERARPGDRRRDRRPRRARPRRRDRPARHPRRGRAAARGDRPAGGEPRRWPPRWARGPAPGAAGLPRAALRRPDGDPLRRRWSPALPGRARRTRQAAERRPRPSARPSSHRELGARPRPARLRPSPRRAPDRRAPDAAPRRARPASSGGTSSPVSPSTTSSGSELTLVATTGFAASIASSSASPKPSQRAGWTSSSARRYHAATSPTRPGRWTPSRGELRALRPLAEHDQHRPRLDLAHPRERPHGDVDALLLARAARRAAAPVRRPGSASSGVLAPRLRAARRARSGRPRPSPAAGRPRRRRSAAATR